MYELHHISLIKLQVKVCVHVAVKYFFNFTYFSILLVGSADHRIYYYDLRNTSNPLYIFSGHKKAVSYVKFLSTNELAFASTDSTLCYMWLCPTSLFVQGSPFLSWL
ncbi:unnamed protein product [Coffea canephora]|uniref:DH200=94 genomic scaffold, scaffold_2008 n=1 Tax=Coffea canephora TaxID=49390 RepID=A0A068VJ97_COFCA|nr:unnamed protein product [Coffea canephora]